MPAPLSHRYSWRPSRIRFNLSALMVLVLFIGSALGWIVHRARAQRDAAAAIERAGGQSCLARRIGTTQGPLWYWLNKSKRGVPAEFVLPIERETGVSRSELRPDLFPEIGTKEEARA